MTSERILRIGVLADSFDAWQGQCLEEILRLPFANIVAVISNSPPAAPGEGLGRRLIRVLREGLLLWRIYERLVVRRRSRALRPKPMRSLKHVPRIRCATVKVGRFREKFDDPAIDSLKGLELDVIIRFSSGILTGDILSIAREGVWSFHHGDPEVFRGAPPGFWEIHNGARVTGVVLQRLTEALDGGVILRRGWFKTFAQSYCQSLDRVLFGATHFVSQALTELHETGRVRGSSIEGVGPIFRYPRNAAVLRFLLRSIAAVVAEQFESLFRHQQWTVGLISSPVGHLVEDAIAERQMTAAISWMPERHGRFLADPFFVSCDDEPSGIRMLAEEFDWRTGVGQIVETGLSADCRGADPSDLTPAIRSKWHLSYPFSFEENGRVFCVPECAESNGVRLYERQVGSGEWVDVATIIEDFPAIDPTLFRHDGRWWMFCTSAQASPNETLFAWYADHFLGPWTQHAANPVKVDIRSARPAGLPFDHLGNLIRPAQDCSRSYGGAVTLNRVVELTPTTFVEETIGVLRPTAGPYPSGLHTLCAAGDRTIVDGSRVTFIPAQMARALRDKFRRAIGRGGGSG